MSTRPPDSANTCPVARSAELIGDRWSLLIVRDAMAGAQRFSDLQRSLGVARNILSDRLRKLVDAGVLQTQAASEGSAYQAYALTPQGEQLFAVVVALRQWGEQHLFAAGEPRSQLVDKASGQALAHMQPVTARGQVLAPGDSEVRLPPVKASIKTQAKAVANTPSARAKSAAAVPRTRR